MDKSGEYRWREWENDVVDGREKDPSTAAGLMAWENWWMVVLLTMLANRRKRFAGHPGEPH